MDCLTFPLLDDGLVSHSHYSVIDLSHIPTTPWWTCLTHPSSPWWIVSHSNHRHDGLSHIPTTLWWTCLTFSLLCNGLVSHSHYSMVELSHIPTILMMDLSHAPITWMIWGLILAYLLAGQWPVFTYLSAPQRTCPHSSQPSGQQLVPDPSPCWPRPEHCGTRHSQWKTRQLQTYQFATRHAIT